MEIAEALQTIINQTNWTQDQLAAKIGKSRSAITNFLRLLKLPPEVKKLISENRIDQGHARALLSISDPQKIVALARQIAEKNLSVREVEKIVNSSGARKKQETPASDANIEKILEKLSAQYKTKVKLKFNKKNKGMLSFLFFSEEDLSRILDSLLRR